MKIKKILSVAVLSAFVFIMPMPAQAADKCCGGHGGIVVCNKATNRLKCFDGTDSQTCACSGLIANAETTTKKAATTNKTNPPKVKNTQVKLEIENAIKDAQNKNLVLSKKLSKIKGTESENIKTIINDLENQIEILKNIKVPAESNTENINAIRKSINSVKTIVQKDFVEANKAIEQAYKNIAFKNSLKTANNDLNIKILNFSKRINDQKTKGYDTTAAQRILDDLNLQSDRIQKLETSTDLTASQATAKTIKAVINKDILAINKTFELHKKAKILEANNNQ